MLNLYSENLLVDTKKALPQKFTNDKKNRLIIYRTTQNFSKVTFKTSNRVHHVKVKSSDFVPRPVKTIEDKSNIKIQIQLGKYRTGLTMPLKNKRYTCVRHLTFHILQQVEHSMLDCYNTITWMLLPHITKYIQNWLYTMNQ